MDKHEPVVRILPHGRQLKTHVGANLLEALLHQSIFLRTDCGGKGTCGKCLVEQQNEDGSRQVIKACRHIVTSDVAITIPESSMLSSHVMSKAPVALPPTFSQRFPVAMEDAYGLAVDIGTTTIAVYLCNLAKGEILASLAVKNPQAIYGDDVMSRIGVIGRNSEHLKNLQKLVVKSIEWGMANLLAASGNEDKTMARMVAVGNPTMVHILAGVDPQSIGVAPYQPAFSHAAIFHSNHLGLAGTEFPVVTLPQISGFIGGDLLAAALAVDLDHQPEGTLLVDLGTNGELIFKGKDKFYATSCATGPAFEGASLSCGMQAIPGAINAVTIGDDRQLAGVFMIQSPGVPVKNPAGICGAGVINAVAQFCAKGIISANGAFATTEKSYILAPENKEVGQPPIVITQKDIRSVQLGKSALITGIEFLLKEAGWQLPRKILIAGAFGSHLQKSDLLRLGIIPHLSPEKIEMVGNAAGTGAVMALCDVEYIEKAKKMAANIEVVELAMRTEFQKVFVENLRFPEE